jgi:glutamate dehydrogenase/leucine dehydrogenase
MRSDSLLLCSPDRFADVLRSDLGGRGWLLRDAEAGGYQASSPRLQPLADFLTRDRRDVRDHEAVFLQTGRGSGCLFGAFLHKTVRGQAQGGVRHQSYATLEAFLRDGLRLSLGMTRKNALARLWWGGGKGLLAKADDERSREPDFRRTLYQEFGAFVSSLQGCYVTAEDAGTDAADMAEVFRGTRFATCIPHDRGGSGNPSDMTAAGVVCAMEAALEMLGHRSLGGGKVVLQGTGNVGSALIRRLLERGVARIVASEVRAEQCEALLDAFDGAPLEIRRVEPGDTTILAEPCDVLAPCALGGVPHPKTIPDVRARVVCGPANNPLADEERDAASLARRGILYVPDFVANRMGIVACANEQYGHLRDDPMVWRHLDPDWEGGIARTTRTVLERARALGVTPLSASRVTADALADEPHPLWGHRAWRIVEELTSGGWPRQR